MRSHGKYSTAQIAFLGVYLAAALILSYVESLIPVIVGIPGVKLGLANLCVLIILYMYGLPEAFLINLCRILISGFLFGNMSMMIYSFAGAFLSLLVMSLLRRCRLFTTAGVSVAGGVAHNIGQIAVAAAVVSDLRIAVYLPVLIISGAVTGFLVGMVVDLLIPHIRRIFEH